MIFCRCYLDIVNSGIEIHEFGHTCELKHCSHPYCTMNVDKSPAALIAKLSYGMKYCPECRTKVFNLFKAQEIVDENGNQIKKLYGLGVKYNYSGNIKIIGNVIRIKLKEMFNLKVNMENFVISKENISEEDIGENGEIKSEKIFSLLSEHGIDDTKYTWWKSPISAEIGDPSLAHKAHNLLFEVNNPIKPQMLWGYSCDYIQYNFGPTISNSNLIYLLPKIEKIQI